MAQWLSEKEEPGKRLGKLLSLTFYPMLLATSEDTALGGGKTTQGQQIELRFSLFCGLCFVKKKTIK